MAVTQHYALINFWYWTYPWLDSVMHFFGGVVISLIASAYLGISWRVIVITIVIGVLWEVYEFMIGISRTELRFVLDTEIDLSMDVTGALVVYGMMNLWKTFTSHSQEVLGELPDQISS